MGVENPFPKSARKEPTVRWNRWISLSVQAVIGAAFLPLTPTLWAADDAPLTAPAGASAADRDEAALRLVNRDTPEAHQEIKNILQNNAAPLAQISVARALAQSPSPDSQLIPSLAALLGSNPQLTDAAANALANYRQNPEAFDQLRHFIDGAGNPNLARIKAVHAIGNMVEPEMTHADYLVNLLGQQNQNSGIKDAAAEALVDLTGVTSPGKDIGKWQQWWAANRGKTSDQFKAMLLSNRVAQFNQLRQRNAQLALSIEDRLKAIYFAAPVPLDSIVLGYLNDPAPDIRKAAIDLVADNAVRNGVSKAVMNKLTRMVGDSDAIVRLSVAEFIYIPRGFDSIIVDPLLDQLAIEKNAGVKQAIAKALGKLQDPKVIPKVVPALLAMLQEKQSDDVKFAANAFANLGEKLRASDAAKAKQVSDVIRQMIKPGQNPPVGDDVRAACMSALAALRDPESFDIFMDILTGGPGVATEVREAALDGLGYLGDTRANQVVADQLNDKDPVIQLKAAAALRTVATPDFDQAIFQKMTNNATEQDTRNYLWQAMQNLFDQESPAQLKRWATQFPTDPEKKLITLQKLGKALYKAADADKAAGNTQQSVTDSDDAALNEQDIADATIAAKPPGQANPTPEQIADAIKHTTIALNYWRQPGKAADMDDKLLALVGQVLDLKLLAGNWTDATDFAAAQLKINPKYAEAVGPRIRDKIDNLKLSSPGEAQKLIDAALAMKPPLPDEFMKDIRDIQNELKQPPPPP